MSAPSLSYDAVLLDLDGTIVRGSDLVPGAAEVVNELRRSGTPVQLITNNASRGPEQVAEHLTALGIRTAADEVLTSGQAAVALLESQLPPGAAILVVGTDALVAAVRTAGLKAVTSAAEHPAAVLQG
ncbi:MAG: HAD family hydrolase, partial [Actinobacteria bacterium]|nr:HAD family hydrolase [Actinomycetota bacterium]